MIENVKRQYGIDAAVGGVFKKSVSAGAAQGAADEANFSSFAVELARVTGDLKNVPEVRQELIDDFAKKVEAGEYSPPLDKIAHNLFLAGILNGED